MSVVTPYNLKHFWEGFCKTMGAKNGDIVWGWIESAYTEPHRHYHTLQHISSCMDLMLELDHYHNNWFPELELAVMFHDIVYDTQAQNNEEKSAEIARNAIGVMNLDSEYKETVTQLILATKHRADLDDSWLGRNLFLDIDLSILGQDPDVFDEYERQIRKEYEWVPQRKYEEARVAVLKSFVDRKNIYTYPWTAVKLEEQARFNLHRSISRHLFSLHEVIRASGDVVCPDCSKEYRKHPYDMEDLSYDGTPFIHILCDGRRVKL